MSMLGRAFASVAVDAESKGTLWFWLIVFAIVGWLVIPTGGPSVAEQRQSDACQPSTVSAGTTVPEMWLTLAKHGWELRTLPDEIRLYPPGCESAP